MPALTGALLVTAPAGPQVAGLVVAGAVEGAVLGAAQASVLRRVVPGLRAVEFTAATAAAAALAYAIGMVPAVLAERLAGLSWPVLDALGAVLGLALLATIGTAQWLVLRRARPGCGFWVPATAASWTAGLGVFLAVSTPLWQPGQPPAVVVGIGLLGGLLMAATGAALTGVALLRLVRPGQPGARRSRLRSAA